MVAGRNDDALAEALTLLAGAIPQMNAGDRERDVNEFCTLGSSRGTIRQLLKELMNLTKLKSGSRRLRKSFEL